jgi:hypothetical protein
VVSSRTQQHAFDDKSIKWKLAEVMLMKQWCSTGKSSTSINQEATAAAAAGNSATNQIPASTDISLQTPASPSPTAGKL